VSNGSGTESPGYARRHCGIREDADIVRSLAGGRSDKPINSRRDRAAALAQPTEHRHVEPIALERNSRQTIRAPRSAKSRREWAQRPGREGEFLGN
jgi:hypothetical protein